MDTIPHCRNNLDDIPNIKEYRILLIHSNNPYILESGFEVDKQIWWVDYYDQYDGPYGRTFFNPYISEEELINCYLPPHPSSEASTSFTPNYPEEFMGDF
jgi:hypothetical protein